MNVAVDRPPPRRCASVKLADGAYAQLKKDLIDARLVPGDRFSETEIAARLGISRTPVREALYRLQREGYLDVAARSGWMVTPLDFESFDHLHDLRLVLETSSVARLCERDDPVVQATLESLRAVWLVEAPPDDRRFAELNEAFYAALVAAAGNPEIARVHGEVTERLRIVRRLDVAEPCRADVTVREHGKILSAILARRGAEATRLLRAHVEAGWSEVLGRRRSPDVAT